MVVINILHKLRSVFIFACFSTIPLVECNIYPYHNYDFLVWFNRTSLVFCSQAYSRIRPRRQTEKL